MGGEWEANQKKENEQPVFDVNGTKYSTMHQLRININDHYRFVMDRMIIGYLFLSTPPPPPPKKKKKKNQTKTNHQQANSNDRRNFELLTLNTTVNKNLPLSIATIG